MGSAVDGRMSCFLHFPVILVSSEGVKNSQNWRDIDIIRHDGTAVGDCLASVTGNRMSIYTGVSEKEVTWP
jgi:hypothetical protein